MSLPERHPPAAFRLAAIVMASMRVAALVTVMSGLSASAGDLLRQGARPNARRPSAAAEEATATAVAQARASAQDALSRTTQAMNAAKALQAAARNAAVARQANNLGRDPNHPGLILPNVPNGLALGGLQVAAGGTWKGADLPRQSRQGGMVKVTVVQKEQQALLDWQSFNVGRNTNLHFNQSAGGNDVGKWIAFNRVTDPSGSPSQILGSITAAGQVYVINQNGIIFGGTSQVNTHILVASSLPINEGLITRGILNNPDAQFLFSALPQAAGVDGTPLFIPPPLPPTGVIGDVTVQPGAQIVAPSTAAKVGGRVVLVGPNVTNAGTISTPDGQTILAAGLQVGFAAHSSRDASLRGLDVFVGAVDRHSMQSTFASGASNLTVFSTRGLEAGAAVTGTGIALGTTIKSIISETELELSTPTTDIGASGFVNFGLRSNAGTVINRGFLDVPRASVTMAGKRINQFGAISSTTSVSLNGRIDLDASYNAITNTKYDAVASPDVAPFIYSSTGTVRMGRGSVMQILPEYDSTDTVVGTELALRSQINVRGKAIYLAPQSTIFAPNATVSVKAGVWESILPPLAVSNTFVLAGGQIYLDRDSMINVAGSANVPVPLSQNILTVELRGDETADAPLQRDSVFRRPNQSNPTITVDLRRTGTYNGLTWYGTPLADLSGYLGLIQRTVGELTIVGGTVNLNAGGSVVVQPGAVVDVSGGYVSYGGGSVQTTRVLHMGRLFEIADALPDRVYEGIYTGLFTESHARWGITRTYKVPWMTGEHYERPYVQGAGGGALSLSASGMALDGTFLGRTISGPRQRSTPPDHSELSLSFQSQLLEEPDYIAISPTPPTISFQENTALLPARRFRLDANGDPFPLRKERRNQVFLSPQLLTSQGFGKLTVDNPDGDILVPGNIHLETATGGSVTLKGSNVTVEGTINSPGGNVSLVAYNISPSVAAALRAGVQGGSAGGEVVTPPPPNDDRGVVTLGPAARLNTAGLVVDDRLSTHSSLSLPMSIDGGSVSISAYSAMLNEGSVIDVSGGVHISATGRATYGNGGSIVINTGQDLSLKSVLGGKLLLGSTLRGYSGAVGGSLAIQAALIQIGGTALHPDTLLLTPEFFRTGGFTSYSLTGIGVVSSDGKEELPAPVYIARGTVIEPVAESLLAIPHTMGRDGVRLVRFMMPDGMRSPVSLSLFAPGVLENFTNLLKVRGDIVMGEGSVIRTEPLGRVSMVGETVAVFGSVYAPGGAIIIVGADKYPSLDENPQAALATVYLAPGSVLSTAGTTVYNQPDRFGHRSGTVLPGGTISVAGNIVAAPGAVLDVSGASGVLDIPPAYLNLNAFLNGPLALPIVPATSGLTTPLYSSLVVPTRVDSSGGIITFAGSEMLFVDALLLGAAGGPTATGGTLEISSGRFYIDNAPSTTADINLVVTQSDPTIPRPFRPGQTGIGMPVLDRRRQLVPGMGYFAADTFLRGGFDSLTLGGNVQFSGRVTINAAGELRIGRGGIISADSVVNLSAPYVALGQPFTPPMQPLQEDFIFTQNTAGGETTEYFLPRPSYGPGRLNVTADILDIGNLSLENIGRTRLISSGDIRGDGTLNVTGHLYLQAGQIYPTTAGNFAITAYDYEVDGKTMLGSITIMGGGVRGTPLSAGGILSIHASNVVQGGVLVAPIGSIILGWDGTGTAPVNALTGAAVPVAQQLTLLRGSVTSVAAIDNVTGAELLIPYGMNSDGNTWIDPFGIDITAGGVPEKTIKLSAVSLDSKAGSLVDMRGGGDLYAFRWIEGTGGSRDILDSSSSFAVIPGYGANFAPYAPFNSVDSEENLALSDPGYVNDELRIGDRIYLGSSPGLPAGYYTLLPARYALLPGAFLVTPKSGSPIGTFTNPDGSSYVSGFRFNDLNQSRQLPGIYERFVVAPGSVVRDRAEYEDFFANTFLRAGAEKVDARVPRLPMDGGYLLMQVTEALRLNGDVRASGAAGGGRGGLIDISSPQDILIGGPRTQGGSGVLTLDSTRLSSFGADSILIGGYREFGRDYTTVHVRTGNITVDNAGSPLSAPEIILVANDGLTLAAGSVIQQRGSMIGPADDLVVSGTVQLGSVGETISFSRGGTPISFPSGTPGDNRIVSTVGGVITLPTGTTQVLAANTATTIPAGSTVTLNDSGTITFESGTGGAIPLSMGDGTLVRVTSDPNARTSRLAVTGSTRPQMTVGPGARLSGNSITLDSTYATSLDPTTRFDGRSINLYSGQISLLFDDPGSMQPTVGLVLAGNALQNLRRASALSLLSYSSIDLYGTGTFATAGSLELHAAQIRGFNQNGGMLAFSARSLLLDNSAGVPALAVVDPPSGTLQFTAATMEIGANATRIDQFNTVVLNASRGLLFNGEGGLMVQHDLEVNTPRIAGARSAIHGLTAGGSLTMTDPGGSSGTVRGGLGATLAFQGTQVTVDSDVFLPSGLLTLRATSGDLTVSSQLDVGGTAQTFYDVVRYTNGGQIRLISDAGSVNLLSGSVVNVAAHARGGNAGTLLVDAHQGSFTLGGALFGRGGANGKGGSFILDVGSLPTLAALNSTLNATFFNQSRIIRVRTGDVLMDGLATTRNFQLSVDGGSITVTGTIDASGETGGTIDLKASGSVVLASGAMLTVAGEKFSNAGRGGSVFLESGSQINGVIDASGFVDVQAGSIIDLSVAANSATSADFGQFTGTLHIRAPQNATSTDLQVNPLNGSILNASSILVEGYKLFDLTNAGGSTITAAVQTSIRNNGIAFVGADGTTTAGYTAMMNRLLSSNAGLVSAMMIVPGAEIINRTGSLMLGATNSNATSDWNLATYRVGPRNAPGVLTIRAFGDLVFFNALSDGFKTSAYNSALLPYNVNAPANAQSWTYRLASGADVTAADFRQVRSLDSLAPNVGSLLLGKNGGNNNANPGGNNATTASAVNAGTGRFQVIRTGTGNITVSAARDVQLLNQFANIYTVGVQVQDPTMGGVFDVPVLRQTAGDVGSLGGIQQQPNAIFVQYTMAGGNVNLSAGSDIIRLTRNTAGVLVPDSERQLPTSWLYRRGATSGATGLFEETRSGLQLGGVDNPNVSDIASTTWWVDFTNYFEGIGALGGGDVTLTAGRDVSNVDAAIPTNARMPGKTVAGEAIAPDASRMLELGGGDLVINAGRNIDGGVYYVERGKGALFAGGDVTTNRTRSPSLGLIASLNNPTVFDSQTWLPTTLFLGKSTIDVSARGDVLLGPMVNAFLLPQGYNNTLWYKTYFSTYSPDTQVTVSSLGGDVTLRKSITLPDTSTVPVLQAWYQKELLLNASSAASSHPWLRLAETNVTPFSTSFDLMPATLKVTAFSGDISTVGKIFLAPSATGTLELLAAGEIGGLQQNGLATTSGITTRNWSSTTINVSDTSPNGIPGIASPFGYQNLFPSPYSPLMRNTQLNFLNSFKALFVETGATSGTAAVLQNQQALHAPGVLHRGDTSPVRLYAGEGDISGLTLYSPKAAHIHAGNDITDVGLYIQNVDSRDISIVSAGRDIVPYNANSEARLSAVAPGNLLNLGELPLSGDLQISGPGTLEVLAGRDISLGTSGSNGDGTGEGISSIGNARNPYLPFEGANLIVGAGMGTGFNLSNSSLDFENFIATVLQGPEGIRYFTELNATSGTVAITDVKALEKLPDEERNRIALQLFYIALRDSGRDYNTEGTAGFGSYAGGFAAIDALFPDPGEGEIFTYSRNIRTRSGGDISIFAPGGGLTLGNTIIGDPEVPPGIITETGGNISIFTKGNTDIGVSRIFTLRGGDIMIWSSEGDIAAGSASKTVASAPPTRVLIDPQSGDITTDLAGLSTGGGIGVLATVAGVMPGNVDLIAPVGTVDAGDAGIRATGNLNIAAANVLNASNISVGGSVAGAPSAPVVAAPNIGGLTAASSTAGASTSAATEAMQSGQRPADAAENETPSIITVDVLGYGGGESDEDEDEERRRRQEAEAAAGLPVR